MVNISKPSLLVNMLKFGDVIQLMIHESQRPAGLEQCLHQNRMHENAPPGFIWDRDVGAFLSSSFFWKWDELRFDEHVFLHLIFGAGHYESLCISRS